MTGRCVLSAWETDFPNDAINICDDTLNNHRGVAIANSLEEAGQHRLSLILFFLRNHFLFHLCSFLSQRKQGLQELDAVHQACLMLSAQLLQSFAQLNKPRVIGVLQDQCAKIDFQLLCFLLLRSVAIDEFLDNFTIQFEVALVLDQADQRGIGDALRFPVAVLSGVEQDFRGLKR